VTLDVYAFNERARAFYEREGFAPLRARLAGPAAGQPAATFSMPGQPSRL
jgi:ribosomal protein S18 acetylase RimI-like enzyme